MMPGTTVLPRRSMTVVARPGGQWAPLPTSRKRPSLIAIVDTIRFRSSIVWMRPLLRMMSGSGCGSLRLFFASNLACALNCTESSPLLAAIAAAAVFMNLRRLVMLPPGNVGELVVRDRCVSDSVEKARCIVPYEHELAGDHDRVVPMFDRGLCLHFDQAF